MPSYTVIGVVVITIICLLLGYEFVSFDKQAFEGEDVEFPQPRVRTTSKPSNLTLKGSPEGSSDQEFRSSILCDVIENS